MTSSSPRIVIKHLILNSAKVEIDEESISSNFGFLYEIKEKVLRIFGVEDTREAGQVSKFLQPTKLKIERVELFGNSRFTLSHNQISTRSLHVYMFGYSDLCLNDIKTMKIFIEAYGNSSVYGCGCATHLKIKSKGKGVIKDVYCRKNGKLEIETQESQIFIPKCYPNEIIVHCSGDNGEITGKNVFCNSLCINSTNQTVVTGFKSKKIQCHFETLVDSNGEPDEYENDDTDEEEENCKVSNAFHEQVRKSIVDNFNILDLQSQIQNYEKSINIKLETPREELDEEEQPVMVKTVTIEDGLKDFAKPETLKDEEVGLSNEEVKRIQYEMELMAIKQKKCIVQ